MRGFADRTGATFPMGDDLAGTYSDFRRAASGSSPNGCHVLIDGDGRIVYNARDYDETELLARIESLL